MAFHSRAGSPCSEILVDSLLEVAPEGAIDEGAEVDPWPDCAGESSPQDTALAGAFPAGDLLDLEGAALSPPAAPAWESKGG